MNLRDFLSTVPLAAVALALPARPEPRYVALMDQCSEKPARETGYRGWYSKVDWEARTAVFTSVERCANGDRMQAEMHTSDSDPNHFAQEVRDLEERHSRWCARLQNHPCEFQLL